MSAVPTFAPFTDGATCPKCGHDDVRTRHHGQTCGQSWSSSAPCKWNDDHAIRKVGEPPPRCCSLEHLDRTCERCLYTWPEAVKS